MRLQSSQFPDLDPHGAPVAGAGPGFAFRAVNRSGSPSSLFRQSPPAEWDPEFFELEWEKARPIPAPMPDVDPPPLPPSTPRSLPGLWARMLRGTLFGIRAKGTLVGQSGSQFAGSSGVGVHPMGALVGQVVSTFVGTMGFGITGRMSTPASVLGNRGYGVAPTGTRLGQAQSYGSGSGVDGLETSEGPGQEDGSPAALFASVPLLSLGNPWRKKGKIVETRCGPDVTRWLESEFERYYKWFEKYEEAAKLDPLTLTAWSVAKAVDVMGPQMMYKETTFFSKDCPAPEDYQPCRDTVTLGEECIHRSEIGNFLLGGIAALASIPHWITQIGAEAANDPAGGDDYTAEDRASVTLGWIYGHNQRTQLQRRRGWGGMIAGEKRRPVLNRLTSVTDVLKRHDWNWQQMQRGAQKTGRQICKPCTTAIKANQTGNHVQLPKITKTILRHPRKIKIQVPKIVSN